MSDQKRRGGGPDRTMAIDTGQDLPAPRMADLYGKRDPLPKNVTARLEMVSGPNAPSSTVITQPVTVLGRGEGIADVPVGDSSASRRHAYIKYRDGAFWLADMGSTNGTVLNGDMVSEAKLKNGDEIQIGTALIRFELAKR